MGSEMCIRDRYASAGHGESTQDMVFAGHDLIAENGTLLSETKPFAGGYDETELDCQRMEAERARNTSFELSGEGYQTVEFDLEPAETTLTRWIDPAPFVPGDPKRRAERCELILKMQADGLAKRLEHAHAKTAVIGISGGLDSCLALLVAVRAMKQLHRPAADVLAVTMPCFGTTKRTRSNAEILCDELHVSFTEIDIAATVHSHFRDIGQDENVLDVTYENGQARVRTLELMDTANRTGGLPLDVSKVRRIWPCQGGEGHFMARLVKAGTPRTLPPEGEYTPEEQLWLAAAAEAGKKGKGKAKPAKAADARSTRRADSRACRDAVQGTSRRTRDTGAGEATPAQSLAAWQEFARQYFPALAQRPAVVHGGGVLLPVAFPLPELPDFVPAAAALLAARAAFCWALACFSAHSPLAMFSFWVVTLLLKACCFSAS